MDRVAGSASVRTGARKIATIFFLAAWFARRTKPDSTLLSGFIFLLTIISFAPRKLWRSRSWDDGFDWNKTAFVVMFVASPFQAIADSCRQQHAQQNAVLFQSKPSSQDRLRPARARRAN